MSGANEYPLAGDLTDSRISGLLHSTLERLARRTAQNNTYITNINEAGPEESFSSPSVTSWAKDPANTGSSQVDRYNWGTSWCCGGGHWQYQATVEPVTKSLGQGTYRRLGLQPHADLTREDIGQIACQNGSTQLFSSVEAKFGLASSTEIPTGALINGDIVFQLPPTFKGFKPNGIQLDLRARGTGLGTSGTPKLTITLTIYKPHCTDPASAVATQATDYVQNTAPAGAEPLGDGIADSIQYDTLGFTAQDLGPFWGPSDTARINVRLTHNVAGDIATLELYTGALKVNYKT